MKTTVKHLSNHPGRATINILIVDDDLINRRLLQRQLSPFGNCEIAVDGAEAILAFRQAWEKSKPYDLICMDIMMPNIDGKAALKEIRQIEKELGIQDKEKVKVIMTTALDDAGTVIDSYQEGASSFLVKPISRRKLTEELQLLGLID